MQTLLIVDDHAAFRAVARVALAERFVIVAEAADGARAVALARELRPERVLLDVQLPDADGFAVVEALAAQDHPPVVVLTSSRDRRELELPLARSSARGFIPKERLSSEALAALLD
ncbi:MAG: response regulator [Gaiellaceae bacterium]